MSMTKGTPLSSQIVTLERLLEERETELAAAKDKYRACRDARIVTLEALECVETERNVLKNRLAEIEAENARLDKALEECEHQTHSMRVRNGSDWHYHPPQVARIAAIVKAERKGKGG